MKVLVFILFFFNFSLSADEGDEVTEATVSVAIVSIETSETEGNLNAQEILLSNNGYSVEYRENEENYVRNYITRISTTDTCDFANIDPSMKTLGHYDILLRELSTFIVQNFSIECLRSLISSYRELKNGYDDPRQAEFCHERSCDLVNERVAIFESNIIFFENYLTEADQQSGTYNQSGCNQEINDSLDPTSDISDFTDTLTEVQSVVETENPTTSEVVVVEGYTPWNEQTVAEARAVAIGVGEEAGRIGFCAKGVRIVLEALSIPFDRSTGVDGKHYHDNLISSPGWRKVECQPENCPVGAVLTYTNTTDDRDSDSCIEYRSHRPNYLEPRPCTGGDEYGHVEIVAPDSSGERSFCSDYCSTYAGGSVPRNYTGAFVYIGDE